MKMTRAERNWVNIMIRDNMARARGYRSNSPVAQVIRALGLDISPEDQELLEAITKAQKEEEEK